MLNNMLETIVKLATWTLRWQLAAWTRLRQRLPPRLEAQARWHARPRRQRGGTARAQRGPHDFAGSPLRCANHHRQ